MTKKISMDPTEVRLAFEIARRTVRRHWVPGLDIDDVVAKAVMQAAEAWVDFVDGGEGSRERWLATIARNIVRDACRRARTAATHHEGLRESLNQVAMAVRPLRPDSVAINGDNARHRQKFYSALPPKLLAPLKVVARQQAGELSRKEAADALGLSMATYDKTATKLKHALRGMADAAGLQSEHLFNIDQAQERMAE